MRAIHMFIRIFGVCLFLLPTASISAGQERMIPDDELQPVLEKIERNFSKIHTLKTMMNQEKTIPVFAEKVVSSGYCIFKFPDKLRLDFIEPFKSSLIVDGSNVYKYEFFDGEWQKLSTGNPEILLMIMGNITSWLKGRFKNPDLYDISAFEKEKMMIRLKPRSDEFKKFITSFELGLNHQLDGLEYIVINESKDSTTKIHFFNDRQNENVSDDLFQGTGNAPSPVVKW